MSDPDCRVSPFQTNAQANPPQFVVPNNYIVFINSVSLPWTAWVWLLHCLQVNLHQNYNRQLVLVFINWGKDYVAVALSSTSTGLAAAYIKNSRKQALRYSPTVTSAGKTENPSQERKKYKCSNQQYCSILVLHYFKLWPVLRTPCRDGLG